MQQEEDINLKETAWKAQHAITSSVLNSKRKSKVSTDLIVVCDGKEFPVHRLHLCCAVPFFAAMFESEMKESKTGRVELQTISSEAMEHVLEFVYTGVIPCIPYEDTSMLVQLLHAADMLQIHPMFVYYLQDITNSVTHSHFVDALEVFELLDYKNNLAKVYSLLAGGFEKILSENEFLRLTVSHLTQILGQDELNRGWDDTIVKGILKWVKFDDSERTRYLDELIKFVDVNSLSSECLLQMQDEPLIKDWVQSLSSATNWKDSERLLSFGVNPTDKLSYMSVFSLKFNKWRKPVKLPFDLEQGMAVAGIDDTVYFIGGGSGETTYIPKNSIIKYSCTSNAVTSHGVLAIGLNQAGAIIVKENIYVVGGRGKFGTDQVLLKAVQRVHLTRENCTLVAPTNEYHNLPSLMQKGEFLYVVGSGTANHFSVERYNTEVNEWTILTKVPGIVKMSSACLSHNKLFVVRTWNEKKFYAYDIEKSTWAVTDFKGGPTSVNGLWLINAQNRSQNFYMLVREANTNTLFSYDFIDGKWNENEVETTCPWFWNMTVVC